MRRREFITLLGGAVVAWPLGASAQQPVPVVGVLNVSSRAAQALPFDGFREGLNQTGYVDGRNVAIEHRWAEGQFDRVPELAADLVRRQVAVIFAGGPPAVRAAQAQTTTIPIVFFMGEDPVKEGLVASLNRPGGNVTGVTNFQNQLFGKQLGILREIAPLATSFALLVNPNSPNAEQDAKEARAAARAVGLELRVWTARNGDELESAFAAMARQQVGGLLVGVNNYGITPQRFVAMAGRSAIPAIYQRRDATVMGGLMSYGANPVDSWRQAGIYVGRILKGEKPSDLPLQQSTKFEFVLNLRTAKALSLDIPPQLLAIADEVIE
jgi:putative ABC transport system substrate-binding protein